MVEIRKVQKLGTSSLIITLPKTWVNRLGIRPGDSVYLVEKERELRIIPFQGEGEFTVLLKNEAVKEKDVTKILRCAMMMGFSKIRIKFESPITKNEENIISSVVSLDRDYEGKVVDPFTYDVNLVNRIGIEEVGAMIRETLSLLEKSLMQLAEAVESLSPKILEDLERTQKLLEQRRFNRKHVARIIEGSRGDLIEERRVCSFVYSSYNVCMGFNSLHRSLIEIVKEIGPEGIVSRENAELIKKIISMYLNALWETIGALTNESLKRIDNAREILTNLASYYRTIFKNENIKNPAIMGILVTILNSLRYFEVLLEDIYCYIESKNLEFVV
ncbi:MAG: AbrB/MazE/SpoVT family DNA-binding domain-containing protein [Fervidicoccaceae archaeon]